MPSTICTTFIHPQHHSTMDMSMWILSPADFPSRSQIVLHGNWFKSQYYYAFTLKSLSQLADRQATKWYFAVLWVGSTVPVLGVFLGMQIIWLHWSKPNGIRASLLLILTQGRMLMLDHLSCQWIWRIFRRHQGSQNISVNRKLAGKLLRDLMNGIPQELNLGSLPKYNFSILSRHGQSPRNQWRCCLYSRRL